eukprot:TRINITY_DN4261_c0_g1_i3.p1 TRINITY_DN4261_c0_g1~~TRINITY_DN4261_c0_g1_i3.p1  ORF type:complete len:1170 (-),score=143.40 TRINITY_DN4261_c0_g1_i3:880-4389(-)
MGLQTVLEMLSSFVQYSLILINLPIGWPEINVFQWFRAVNSNLKFWKDYETETGYRAHFLLMTSAFPILSALTFLGLFKSRREVAVWLLVLVAAECVTLGVQSLLQKEEKLGIGTLISGIALTVLSLGLYYRQRLEVVSLRKVFEDHRERHRARPGAAVPSGAARRNPLAKPAPPLRSAPKLDRQFSRDNKRNPAADTTALLPVAPTAAAARSRSRSPQVPGRQAVPPAHLGKQAPCKPDAPVANTAKRPALKEMDSVLSAAVCTAPILPTPSASLLARRPRSQLHSVVKTEPQAASPTTTSLARSTAIQAVSETGGAKGLLRKGSMRRQRKFTIWQRQSVTRRLSDLVSQMTLKEYDEYVAQTQEVGSRRFRLKALAKDYFLQGILMVLQIVFIPVVTTLLLTFDCVDDVCPTGSYFDYDADTTVPTCRPCSFLSSCASLLVRAVCPASTWRRLRREPAVPCAHFAKDIWPSTAFLFLAFVAGVPLIFFSLIRISGQHLEDMPVLAIGVDDFVQWRLEQMRKKRALLAEDGAVSVTTNPLPAAEGDAPILDGAELEQLRETVDICQRAKTWEHHVYISQSAVKDLYEAFRFRWRYFKIEWLVMKFCIVVISAMAYRLPMSATLSSMLVIHLFHTAVLFKWVPHVNSREQILAQALSVCNCLNLIFALVSVLVRVTIPGIVVTVCVNVIVFCVASWRALYHRKDTSDRLHQELVALQEMQRNAVGLTEKRLLAKQNLRRFKTRLRMFGAFSALRGKKSAEATATPADPAPQSDPIDATPLLPFSVNASPRKPKLRFDEDRLASNSSLPSSTPARLFSRPTDSASVVADDVEDIQLELPTPRNVDASAGPPAPSAAALRSPARGQLPPPASPPGPVTTSDSAPHLPGPVEPREPSSKPVHPLLLAARRAKQLELEKGKECAITIAVPPVQQPATVSSTSPTPSSSGPSQASSPTGSNNAVRPESGGAGKPASPNPNEQQPLKRTMSWHAIDSAELSEAQQLLLSKERTLQRNQQLCDIKLNEVVIITLGKYFMVMGLLAFIGLTITLNRIAVDKWYPDGASTPSDMKLRPSPSQSSWLAITDGCCCRTWTKNDATKYGLDYPTERTAELWQCTNEIAFKHARTTSNGVSGMSIRPFCSLEPVQSCEIIGPNWHAECNTTNATAFALANLW